MRWPSLIGLVLLLVCVSQSQAVTPMGDWKLDEGSGSVAKDSSGNGNNGVIHGSPTWVPGPSYGRAMHFDGSTYIEIPNTSDWNFPAGFTIQAWFRCGNQLYPEGPIVFKHQSGVMAGFGLGVTSPDNHGVASGLYLLAEQGEVSSGGIERIYGGNFTDNRWHEAVGKYDGTALSLYVDGNLVAHKDHWQYSSFSPENIRIGGLVPGQFHCKFIGDIGEVKIYATPRTVNPKPSRTDQTAVRTMSNEEIAQRIARTEEFLKTLDTNHNGMIDADEVKEGQAKKASLNRMFSRIGKEPHYPVAIDELKREYEAYYRSRFTASSPPRAAELGVLDFQPLPSNIQSGTISRAKVEGGWLIKIEVNAPIPRSRGAGQTSPNAVSITFYPDPQHTWGGGSLK